jgi:hypothetical protein
LKWPDRKSQSGCVWPTTLTNLVNIQILLNHQPSEEVFFDAWLWHLQHKPSGPNLHSSGMLFSPPAAARGCPLPQLPPLVCRLLTCAFLLTCKPSSCRIKLCDACAHRCSGQRRPRSSVLAHTAWDHVGSVVGHPRPLLCALPTGKALSAVYPSSSLVSFSKRHCIRLPVRSGMGRAGHHPSSPAEWAAALPEPGSACLPVERYQSEQAGHCTPIPNCLALVSPSHFHS